MFRTFDSDGNLLRLSGVYQGAGTGTPLDTFSYANNGLVSARSEGSSNASSATYGWDDVNRLTSQSDGFLSGTNNVGWTFGMPRTRHPPDGAGSRHPASQITTETRNNDAYAQTLTQGSAAYVPNGLNQYSSVGGKTYSYDANGNLTSDGTTTYTFDIENRLVKAATGQGGGGTTTNLVYDPLGRLYQTDQGTNATTTRFLTDGDAIVLEFNSSNAILNRFVHGRNAAADDPLLWYSGSGLTTKRWLHADHLGSIVAWTNSSGGSPTINTYDEYGVPGASNSGRFQYTGQAYIPELKLYYYKARFYSPGLGRFLQTDPVGYDDQYNLYEYVGNDPVDRNDPSGDEQLELNFEQQKKLTEANLKMMHEHPTATKAVAGVAAVAMTGGTAAVAMEGATAAVAATASATEAVSATAAESGTAAAAGGRTVTNLTGRIAERASQSLRAPTLRSAQRISISNGPKPPTITGARTIQPEAVPPEYRAAQMAAARQGRAEQASHLGDVLEGVNRVIELVGHLLGF